MDLEKYASPRAPGEVVFISDVNLALAALAITEFETLDVAGPRFTLSSGEIMNVYGKAYVHTSQMRVSQTTGSVSSTASINTVSRLLCVNTSQWRVGFRRQITFEADREPGKGQTTLYCSFRIALLERSGTRSTAIHTALGRNITGTT